MKDFMRQNGWIVLVIALLLSLIVAGGTAILEGSLNPISNVVATVTTPIRNVASTGMAWCEDVADYILRYGETEEELKKLRLQVAELEEEVRSSDDAVRENEQLRDLLDLQQKRSDFVFESARVAAQSTSNWESTITLNKGSLDGVAVNQCVITEVGQLVGTVTEVGLNSATVSTVIDSGTEMSGIVSRTYAAGILEGDFSLMHDKKLKMTYLSEDAQLVAGDKVLTAGIGETYPPNLVVGTVESLHSEASGIDRYAVIVPDVNMDDLVEVFIIKEFDVAP